MLSEIELRRIEVAGSEDEQVRVVMQSRSLGYEAAYDLIAAHFGASPMRAAPQACQAEATQDGGKFCYDDATGLTILPAEDD